MVGLYEALRAMRHSTAEMLPFARGGKERENLYFHAKVYYLRNLELSRQSNDIQQQATNLASLGDLAIDMKDWTQACKWFEQALPLAKGVGRQELIAHAQYGLARVHEAEGRADLTLPLAQEALKIYERLQHRNLAAVRGLVERLKERLKAEG